MPRLIVVSNRVPSLKDGQLSGGLAVALKATLEETGGVWFGWSGRLTDEPAMQPASADAGGFRLATIDLPEREYQGYYEQHANRGLWPLFHGRIDLTSFDHESHGLYRAVNRRFATTLLPSIDEDSVIWVHDYHLIPLGAELRRMGVTAPIGFFLHIPFPAPETLAALPWHRELLEELSAYDVVGFQTTGCVQNFRSAFERRLTACSAADAPAATSRSPHVARFPIGIDTEAFATLADSPKVRRSCERLAAVKRNQIWAVGVERLDYTKGLAERFQAFEALLDEEPDLRHRLSLIQIAAPSRETVAEYQDMQSELEALSGRINARLGSFDWTPIRYINRSFNHTLLAALYRISRIGVVTPLRDGMNLVAKEYVAAQNPEDPGVLVLSRFAGAAEELTDALMVNPHDTEAMAQTLKRAIIMPVEERRMRWERMMLHLETHDVHRWRRQFLDTLISAGDSAPTTTAVA